MKHILWVFTALLSFSTSFSQKNKSSKYPSLFWEITGNGMNKPSYLFGTMHVSNKMAFHLSDSFYTAMKNVDVVSLELNPESWQIEMFRMEQEQSKILKYNSRSGNDYMNEKSFRLDEYDDDLKQALSEEPNQVNNLLYRTYGGGADFQENTYLDLYLYQTGRKLGKKGAGVEHFIESQKLMTQALQDMMKEKKRKKVDTDGESMYEINKKIQDAYRRGDLDLLDSLQRITSTSDAYTEKFLYKRNEIQANNMDSIMKKEALFVGVGAAHLAGERGVIELLRKKGYLLRPIKMNDRDAEQKDKIDKMKVPVIMKPVTTPDGFITLQVPGPLFKRNETRRNEGWQYADMENGTYYTVTRIKTHAALLGQKEDEVLQRVDSFLYEFIPGKIIQKSTISKNGYKGFDITNKTKRGDFQKYHILTTPHEIIVFKMSGHDDYVQGQEALDFFSSIQLKEQKNNWTNYQPTTGGFSVLLPQVPNVYFNTTAKDGNDVWEYEATDKKTGDAFAVWKKNIHNYRFLEEDSFELSMMEESLLKSEIIEKQLSRKQIKWQNHYALDMHYLLKGGETLKARAIIVGTNYYLLLARVKQASNADKFIKSFTTKPIVYPASNTYSDTSLQFTVQTPVFPVFDNDIKEMAEKSNYQENVQQTETYNAFPKNKNALFINDSTGEAITVLVKSFPKYYFRKDSASFWKDQIKWDELEKEFIVQKQSFVNTKNHTSGYTYELTDTNCSRKIKGMFILKQDRLYQLITETTLNDLESRFINQFFNSFSPLDKNGSSVFDSKMNIFFSDYYSNDTTTRKKAISAISNIYFDPSAFGNIQKAIDELTLIDNDYFAIKSKFIAELGYLKDSTVQNDATDYLMLLHRKTADTTIFQNTIVNALSKLKTTKSYQYLGELLLQDPPVFNNNYNYNAFFYTISDSLQLARQLFPQLLELNTIDEYKKPVLNLLKTLVDSSLITAKDYSNYFSKIYIDAKTELKKQQIRDEKIMERESKKEDDNNNPFSYNSSMSYFNTDATNYYGNNSALSNLHLVASLLAPFYDTKKEVQQFFEKLLLSKDKSAQLLAVTKLLSNNQKVTDSIFLHLAASDEYRSLLLKQLEQLKKTNQFPEKFKQQSSLAISILLNQKRQEKFHAIESVGNRVVSLKSVKGRTYFFKYKIKKEDDWMMGISGFQPVDEKEVNSSFELVSTNDKKIKDDEPMMEQFEKKLKQMLFAKRKSSAQFYDSRGNRNLFGDMNFNGNNWSGDED